jgi:hypothetical protein
MWRRTGMETTEKHEEEPIAKVERPKRAKLTEEEIIKRMESFDERKERFIASVRKSKS